MIPEVVFEAPDHRVKADARQLVGDQALSCIKCHRFVLQPVDRGKAKRRDQMIDDAKAGVQHEFPDDGHGDEQAGRAFELR